MPFLRNSERFSYDEAINTRVPTGLLSKLFLISTEHRETGIYIQETIFDNKEIVIYIREIGIYIEEIGIYSQEIGIDTQEIAADIDEIGIYSREIAVYNREISVYWLAQNYKKRD